MATVLLVRSWSCSHRAVWKHGPRKVSSPGQVGTFGTLRNPVAQISTWHRSSSPVLSDNR